jgi:hypothetical protein
VSARPSASAPGRPAADCTDESSDRSRTGTRRPHRRSSVTDGSCRATRETSARTAGSGESRFATSSRSATLRSMRAARWILLALIAACGDDGGAPRADGGSGGRDATRTDAATPADAMPESGTTSDGGAVMDAGSDGRALPPCELTASGPVTATVSGEVIENLRISSSSTRSTSRCARASRARSAGSVRAVKRPSTVRIALLR